MHRTYSEITTLSDLFESPYLVAIFILVNGRIYMRITLKIWSRSAHESQLCVTKVLFFKTLTWRWKITPNMREFELQSLKSLRSVPLVCIKIISSSGKASNLTVSLRDTVKAVKDKALGGEFSKESPCYKLILARSSSELIDQKTLEEENVQDNGKCRISYQDV